ncbi:hypothetical protein QOZ80_3BG0271340 [Eleusine coracana subsp. coracana]|nr:hypothetical protein QOZ80_3BG0271340 [Eleusine coracana subsp. coracana]
MLIKNGELRGDEVIAEFERLTRDAAAVQQETLRRILSENADVEYLRGRGLDGRTDPDSFRSCVPLVTHEDLEPYICRIADGNTSSLLLTAKLVTSISLSSSTTQGKRKFLPFNDELFKSAMLVYRTSFSFRNRAFPVEDGKTLQFVYASKEFTTPGGLTATTATTHLYRSKEFKPTTGDVQLQPTSPNEVVFGPDFDESLYCHLLCGLLFNNQVQTVSATFAHNLVLAFQAFERVWPELCEDIRRGAPSPARVATPAVHQAVAALLRVPNPALADEVARACAGLKQSNWKGLIPVLWPNAKYVHAIVTGSMEHYVKKLRHYAGGLPLVAADYGASEGMIAPNVEPDVPPEAATFAVLPSIAYFEFIPLKLGDGNPVRSDECYSEAQPIGLTDVAVGEYYEVVMTTFTGLYRYRLGDMVKVTGFYNSTPKLKFVCRRNLMLSINIDKNGEQDIQLAVDGAVKNLVTRRLEVVDYTSYADMSSDPGHYVVFWELNNEANDTVLQSCCDELDRGFADAGYMGSRKTHAIGPLELRVLHKGTFQKVLRHYLSLGFPPNQFKLPRCISRSNFKALRILSGNTVKVFFSTAYN